MPIALYLDAAALCLDRRRRRRRPLHLLRVVSIVQTCSTTLVEFYYAN